MCLRRAYCLSCHRLTQQDRVDIGQWRCLRCGHSIIRDRVVFVVLSSPTTTRADDVWIEGVFSTLERAIAFVRQQGPLASQFWIEPFEVDKSA